MNKIILAFEVHSLVTETDVMNYNEEGTKAGRCTGSCGNPDDSWYEDTEIRKGYKEAVMHELRLNKRRKFAWLKVG